MKKNVKTTAKKSTAKIISSTAKHVQHLLDQAAKKHPNAEHATKKISTKHHHHATVDKADDTGATHSKHITKSTASNTKKSNRSTTMKNVKNVKIADSKKKVVDSKKKVVDSKKSGKANKSPSAIKLLTRLCEVSKKTAKIAKSVNSGMDSRKTAKTAKTAKTVVHNNKQISTKLPERITARINVLNERLAKFNAQTQNKISVAMQELATWTAKVATGKDSAKKVVTGKKVAAKDSTKKVTGKKVTGKKVATGKKVVKLNGK